MRDPTPPMPALSPRFLVRLPELVDTLLEVRNIIEEPIQRAELAIAEIQDFIEFEIGKLELAAKLDRLPSDGVERLKSFQEFKGNFPAAAMQAMKHTINDLYDAMQPYMPDPLAGSYDPSEDYNLSEGE